MEKDFETIGETLDEDKSSAFDTKQYKEHIKDNVRKTAFKDLEDKKVSHSKVRENIYSSFDRPQEYLTSKTFTNQQSFLIFALKSKTVRNIKENFPNMNSDNSLCPVCERSPDTQQHILDCQVLKNILPMHTDVEYNKLFGTTQEQKEFIIIYEKYLEERDELLLGDPNPQLSLPGLRTGPLLPQARTMRYPARRGNQDTVKSVSCGI